MKKLLLLTIVSCLAMVSCNPKDIDEGPEAAFSDITVTPESPKAGEEIVITARISANGEPFVAVMEWKEDFATSLVTTTLKKVEGDLYKAQIPSQAPGAKLTFNLRASTKRGRISRTANMFINVQPTPIWVEQMDIRLNEINGNGTDADKYIELYNTTTSTIRLDGLVVTYGDKVTWTGIEGQVLQPSSFFVILGRNTPENPSGMMSTGLSASKGIVVELLNSNGENIDTFTRGTAQDATVTGPTGMDYSRIKDGVGEWYLTNATGTRGLTNGISTAGLETVAQADDKPVNTADNGIRFNEINGTGFPYNDQEVDNQNRSKYVELYNTTSSAIALENMSIKYGGKLSWKGAAEHSIPAKGFFLIKGSKGTAVTNGGLSTGLSAGKGILLEFFDAAGALVDTFSRGAAPDDPVSGPTDKAYSRIADGAGAWYLTDPTGTGGLTNGISTAGLITITQADAQ